MAQFHDVLMCIANVFNRVTPLTYSFCKCMQCVCLIDNISIQFVANRLLPANCC